ncbi:S-methyl-5-thioribose-1-phosphate isomerase [Acidihalobacter ferrooxydans]|uniref:Methylthioribose-1-phosphate isomerase n=1 Tax=Acidihalobacter ferrooxydans TaxID=1765967 RepID=A0A1P8UGB2_9GAMM|nr:S-methyl-5-thioribose-1-phosphate isomerase [Acidihalobacter ferrooxydans]APZ42804.1 S-methyl-5-thioribose-1-phosphate isomerase [Acidihalobacter ferrooxydans]
MSMSSHDQVRPMIWAGDHLRLLDQRLLPGEELWLELRESEAVAQAIREMAVRGAPAIGIAAAFGAALAAREADGERTKLMAALATLGAARPTAVNLEWALQRMRGLIEQTDARAWADALLAEAQAIHAQDIAANHRIGELGGALIERGAVLTHCNTGSLATGGFGTALGVIRSAWSDGRITRVYADETRPWLQGSRLTAWELVRDDIPVTLLCEGAAASLLASGEVSWVVVGADRIAANGDVANKIGTYGLAVLARHHGVKFMVAAPLSTVDMSMSAGADIPVEVRAEEELLGCGGVRVAAPGARAWNPVFDVTPASLIDAIVTEAGIVEQPGLAGMHELFGQRA